jgi:Domain of unknown function (DUF5615)
LRLLLDEPFSPEIARQLRSLDHDVEAVVERLELVSLADRELFARMAAERRAIVTNNVPDYVKPPTRHSAPARRTTACFLPTIAACRAARTRSVSSSE